ncbi:MAG TPA: enoyl-CoA hydratase [Burkholderiales bacterium]|jgi:enoyl-CoA hydratase/carnithine racemase|nr:enoyl-CoA hydratase [Burkholderiales bacterium]
MEVLASKEAGVLRITLNRPEKKNSITGAMYQALADALADARRDPAVKAVMITGGVEMFAAGNDLGDFMNNPPQDEGAPVFQFLTQISECEKPIVAAVAGVAVGIGTTMLLHCDLVYAADNARFALPFTSLGIVPEAASSYLLPLIAGYQQAAELLLLGEPFGAERAKQAGFVTAVVPAGELLPAAEKAAARLAALPGKSIRTTKALLKQAHAAQVARQMHEEGVLFRAMLTEPAAREAMSAFFAKRKPDFSQLE